MTENLSFSSSQESLPLSQETFNSLMNMMDLSGRAELAALADIDTRNWVVPECPVQPEASSPLGTHAPYTRSSLPATCSWPGAYNFQLLFGNQEKINKHVNWAFSHANNKLFVQKDALCPFSFQTNTQMSDDVFLRAMAVYSSPEHASSVVHRCVNHSQKEIVDGIFEAEHLIRSDSQLARYEIDVESKRHSVIVPFENPPVGQDYSTYIFKFACFSSCPGGPNRRPLTLIFTLEQRSHVLGRVVLDLKICACPGRDKVNSENPRSSQPTTSDSAPKSMKRESSSVSIPQDYFENFRKKKKLEEEKTENKEFIIKVKDKECFHFLLSMKKLFQGHKRFGRLPPECRTLLRLYKSSSDEDEMMQ